MIIHVFISRGLDNDTYRNLICFLFDYFYLHVYFIVDKETKHMVGNIMLFKKHQNVYVLKYMNKYYKMASYASSPNDYLTDDVLEATKFPFKEGLESLIKIYKNREPRYGTEFYLKEIITNAEIKNLVIDLKGYVDD